ncbi:MAG: HEAT repeat domain-containing protein [Myxococcales bacterium]|nr:HEAT repeat domain-containing protein [Myxococcales bacterium]
MNQDGNDDFVKIIDFGIAKDVKAVPGLQTSGQLRVSATSVPMVPEKEPEPDEDFSLEDTPGQNLTQAGQLVGTPLYMAPEQIRSGLHDAKGDQYAVGCILYFMLTGQPVFTGKKADEIMSAHVKQKVVPPRQRVHGLAISDVLESVVMRALAKDPADRFLSMRALEDELNACIEKLVPSAKLSGRARALQVARRFAPLWGSLLLGLVGLLIYLVRTPKGGGEDIPQTELLALRARALAVLTKQAMATEPRLKLGALRALGHSRDGAQRALLEKRLDDEDPSVVAQAAEALGLLGEPAAAASLLARSGRVSDPAVKSAMAVALERLGEPRGTQLLYEGLASKDTELRLLSALLLCDRGNRTAVELLLSVLEKGQVGGPIELSVLGCLARAGNESAYKALLVKLQRSEPREAQLKAAQQLMPLGEARAQALLEKLAMEPGRDQLLAARYLASTDHTETAPVFRSVLVDDKASSTATILAAEGLGLSGRLIDVRMLDAQLQRAKDEQVQLASAEAIVRLAATDVRLMSERSLLWARDALSSGSWAIRQAGVATLSDRQEQEAGSLIVSMLRDPVSQVRKAAVRALARRNDASALDVLKAQLGDADSAVRLESLQAVVRLAKRLIDAGQRPTVDRVSGWLREVVQRGSVSEQVVARSGLLMLGDGTQKAALKQLATSSDEDTKKLLAEQPGADVEILAALLTDASDAVRFAAARRLAERGESIAKPVLRQAASQGSSEAVTASALLNRLGEKTERPQLSALTQASLPVEKRMQLVESVQNLEANVAVPVLLQLARDPEPLVRRLVVEIAADLPGATATSTPGLPVLKLLASDSDAAVRARVWGLLSRFGTASGQDKPPTTVKPPSRDTGPQPPPKKSTDEPSGPQVGDAPTVGQGRLSIEASPGTLIQLDDKPWQNATAVPLALAAGKHTLRSLSGERTIEIVPSQTLTIKLADSEAEQLLGKGIDSLGKSDFRRAQKLLEKAHGQCKKNKALATPCELLAFEGSFHLATALEGSHRLPEAMTQYQKILKSAPKSKSRQDRRGEIQAAVNRLSAQMGEVVIAKSKKGKCQQSSLWVLPGTHILSIEGKSQQVQVSAQQRLQFGSCK